MRAPGQRLERDMALCVKYKVPIIITSLGARPEINEAAHQYGGLVLHDVISDDFARNAIVKGADGLIAVAAGAGGHAGTKSPFALVQEIRDWFDGPLALSGSISTGDAVLAAQAAGADLAYIGSAFIATEEAQASPDYKQAIVENSSDGITYTNFLHGRSCQLPDLVHRCSGLRPLQSPASDPTKMDFDEGGENVERHLRMRARYRCGPTYSAGDRLRCPARAGVRRCPAKAAPGQTPAETGSEDFNVFPGSEQIGG